MNSLEDHLQRPRLNPTVNVIEKLDGNMGDSELSVEETGDKETS